MPRFSIVRSPVARALGAFLAIVWLHSQSMHAQVDSDSTPPVVSCDEFLPAAKQVGNRTVGPAQCRIVTDQIVFNARREPYRHLELRISGTLDGVVLNRRS